MEMYNVEQVAAFLNVSPRTVQRLASLGRMPAAVKLGSLARWSLNPVAEQWTAKRMPDSIGPPNGPNRQKLFVDSPVAGRRRRLMAGASPAVN